MRRELVSDRAWYGGEYFNEFPRLARLDDHIHSNIQLGSTDRSVGFGVHRDTSDQPFGARETRIVNIVLQQLPWLVKHMRGGRQSGLWQKLTPRHQEVVRRLLTAESRKQIAYALELSEHTINDHIKTAYQRLGVSGRAELFALFADVDNT
ncbi:MAG: hypothetical protein GXP29_01275 [Planctomycetes bacterium]|nr:hypothetical protein [Planctomycetota bacterium]